MYINRETRERSRDRLRDSDRLLEEGEKGHNAILQLRSRANDMCTSRAMPQGGGSRRGVRRVHG